MGQRAREVFESEAGATETAVEALLAIAGVDEAGRGPLAGPVIAAFAGFCPAMVAKALPDAWSRTTPQACLDTRAKVSTAALRGAGVDPAACEQAASVSWMGVPETP